MAGPIKAKPPRREWARLMRPASTRRTESALFAPELHQISRHGEAGNAGEIETGPRMQHHFQRSREGEYIVLWCRVHPDGREYVKPCAVEAKGRIGDRHGRLRIHGR